MTSDDVTRQTHQLSRNAHISLQSPQRYQGRSTHTHTHTQTGGFAWPTFEHHSVAAGLRHLEAPGSYSVCAEKWRQGRKVGLRKKSLP